MKLVKTLAAAAVLAMSSFATQASTINVGGVTWDPDYIDGGDGDFIGEFKFTQWFSNTNSAVGNLSNYSSAVGINSVLSSLNPSSSSATGFFLQGVGEFDRINANFANITSFCNSCELLYAFGGIGLNKDASFDLNSAWARVWVNGLSPNYTVPASSQTEVNDALVGFNTPWLDLKFAALQFTPGSLVQNGTVSAIFQAVGGSALFNFMGGNTNGLISYTADANFNTASNAKYSSGGNGSVLSDTIPTPSSLAVLGLGLIGLVGASRRKNSK